MPPGVAHGFVNGSHQDVHVLVECRAQEFPIELIFGFVAQLVIEILGQVVFEFITAFGWESVKHSARRRGESRPVLAGIGHLLLGLSAGALSVWIVPRRLFPQAPWPGVSLVLSPIATGMIMRWIGEWWSARVADRPALFSFRAGAIFAFGMALVRFAFREIDWRMF